jgi:hypothetical protein
MSLLSKALGNAVEFSTTEANNNLAKILIPNEQVVKAYKLVRDQIIFTNERLILIDQSIVNLFHNYHQTSITGTIALLQ